MAGMHVAGTCLALAAALLSSSAATADDAAAPPVTVTELMGHLGFSESLKKPLLDGRVLSTGMPEMEKKKDEMAVSAAMLVVHRPLDDVVKAYMDGEIFRLDPELRQFQEIPGPPASQGVKDAFAHVGYTSHDENEAQRLIKFRGGELFNLSSHEIELFGAIPPRGADVLDKTSATWRTVLAQRHLDYLKEGLGGIDPYVRTGGKKVFPGKELTVATASMTLLRDHFADFYDTILTFPTPLKRDKTPVEHRFFWIETRVQDRPTFVLTHHASDLDKRYAIILEQQYYVGLSYNSMEAMLGCVPFDDGTVVFYTTRVFTDQITGFAAGIARGIGRGKIEKSVTDQLETLRTLLEHP